MANVDRRNLVALAGLGVVALSTPTNVLAEGNEDNMASRKLVSFSR
jgi:hypothetical protein